MKHIILKIAGTGAEPLDIFLHPGVTAWDILDAARLKGCILCLGANPAKTFALEEEPYDDLTDGDTLYAVLPTGIRNPIYREHKKEIIR